MPSLDELGILKVSDDGYPLYEAKILPDQTSGLKVRASEIIKEKDRTSWIRPKYDPIDVLRVMVCFPSKKETKNKPIMQWLEKRIKETVHTDKISFTEFCYTVTNTGVGEQPFHNHRVQGGRSGALQRIRHGLPEVEDVVSEYHAVFFIAVESDIDMRGKMPYDKANIILFEYHSRFTAGVMSRGPTVQPELLALRPEKGETYGQVLESLFGVLPGDWHREVCKKEKELNCRAAFIAEALDRLLNHSQVENIFSFCLYR